MPEHSTSTQVNQTTIYNNIYYIKNNKNNNNSVQGSLPVPPSINPPTPPIRYI